MLTSKQRAHLRSMANGLPAAHQIGKDALSAQGIKQIDDYLEQHELIKVVVRKSLDCDIRALADQAAADLGAECVQVVGRRFVLYRYSGKRAAEGKAIALPRA